MSGGSDIKRGRVVQFPGGFDATRGRNALSPGGFGTKRGRVAPFPSGSDAARGRNTPEPGGDAVWLSIPNAMRIINPWVSTCGFMSSCDILGLCDPAKCFHAAFLHFARSQSPKMRHDDVVSYSLRGFFLFLTHRKSEYTSPARRFCPSVSGQTPGRRNLCSRSRR